MAQPLKTYRFGNISAAVFENVGKDFTTISVQIVKNYKDSDGNWKTTNSFKPDELYKLSELARLVANDYYNSEVSIKDEATNEGGI